MTFSLDLWEEISAVRQAELSACPPSEAVPSGRTPHLARCGVGRGATAPGGGRALPTPRASYIGRGRAARGRGGFARGAPLGQESTVLTRFGRARYAAMASKDEDDGQRIEDLWGQLDRTHLDERDTELHRSSVPAHGVRKGASRCAARPSRGPPWARGRPRSQARIAHTAAYPLTEAASVPTRCTESPSWCGVGRRSLGRRSRPVPPWPGRGRRRGADPPPPGPSCAPAGCLGPR